MALISEAKLRLLLKDYDKKIFEIDSNDIITPQARGYLMDLKIKLVKKTQLIEKTSDFWVFKGKTKSKPENMTHLYGTELINKDNEIIVFRGKLDSLQSEILMTQLEISELNDPELVEKLQKILVFTRMIMQSEVKNIPFNSWNELGMTSDEIRKKSHNPKKYFGKNHILPNYEMGRKILLLNKLRSMTREVELIAVKALDTDSTAPRIDIIEALNRLSSYFYICMVESYGRD